MNKRKPTSTGIKATVDAQIALQVRPKKLHTTMASLPATESLKSEAELPPPTSIENASHHQAGRAEWVLDSPDPPSLWHDLLVSIRETLLLNNSNDDKKKSPLTHKQALCRGATSLFQGLFPILCWGKSYRISKFKGDLMAGLTLASLCIPQVKSSTEPDNSVLWMWHCVVSSVLRAWFRFLAEHWVC